MTISFPESTICIPSVMESTIERGAIKNVQANYLCCERTLFDSVHVCRKQFFTGDVKMGLQNWL